MAEVGVLYKPISPLAGELIYRDPKLPLTSAVCLLTRGEFLLPFLISAPATERCLGQGLYQPPSAPGFVVLGGSRTAKDNLVGMAFNSAPKFSH